MKILVADDDPDVVSAVQQLLRSEKHEIVTATDGLRALGSLLDGRQPSIAILDSVMPGMSGPKVCRKARAALGNRPLHIILLTVLTRDTEVENGLAAGTDDYMAKPFSPRELIARVRAAERVIGLQNDLAKRIRELEEALQRVKTLEGLLPICMYCKRVRNEKNFWEQVETYVADHSHARFSHGICAECEQKHLPPECRERK